MSGFGIRSRMLLAALAPATLVALLLGGILVVGRLNDVESGLRQQATNIARHTAAIAEYPLFVGDIATLEHIAGAAARDPEVLSVTVLDEHGTVLANAGRSRLRPVALRGTESPSGIDKESGVLRLTLPVRAASVTLSDPISGLMSKGEADEPRIVGYIATEMSLERVEHIKHRLLAFGGLTILGCLLLGAALARRLAGEIAKPVERVAETVRRIGQGDLSARVAGAARSEDMRRLERGVNEMAERVALSHEDLSRRVEEATRELRAKKEEAETATRAKSRFLAAASHDLRQPMQALGLFVSRLAQQHHRGETGKLVQRVDASVRNLQNLIDELLDVSRLDAGAVVSRLRTFALDEMFERLAADYDENADGKGGDFKVRPCAWRVVSDPVLLERILRNLIVNALRYTARGRVLVGCRRRGDSLSIEVWDTGCGIPPEQIPEIFREFVQLSNPERDRAKGLGLGLAIVARLGALLGHEIGVSSRVGRGSRFAVRVPLAIEPETRTDETGMSSRVLTIGRCGAALREQLEAWDYAVAAVDDADAALDAGAPFIAFCDLTGNDGNAFATARRCRERFGEGLPVVALCAESAADAATRARAAAANLHLLTEPYRPSRLRSLLVAAQTKEGGTD